MEIYYLRLLRDEADKYYHLRLNTSGTYDIFFHNYKVVKLCTIPIREDALNKLKEYKREHILKRIKQLKNK